MAETMADYNQLTDKKLSLNLHVNLAEIMAD